MKKKLLLISITLATLAICLIPVGLATSGCAGTTISQSTIDSTAVLLRGAARDGAVIAIKDDANTKEYFQLAVTALETFITGKDYTPGSFQKALTGISSSSLNNQWVQIGIGTVIDLYQLYFSQYVQSSVNGSAVAKAFLVAVQDGFNEALGNPVSAHRLGGARGVYGAYSGVLPRQVKP